MPLEVHYPQNFLREKWAMAAAKANGYKVETSSHAWTRWAKDPDDKWVLQDGKNMVFQPEWQEGANNDSFYTDDIEWYRTYPKDEVYAVETANGGRGLKNKTK